MNRREFVCSASAVACGMWLAPGLFSRLANANDYASLAKQIPKWMEEFHIAGASLAIVREKQPVWTRGFGWRNYEKHLRVDDATVFEAASISKPVFAYAVLRLVAEGRFDLDRPLVAYLANPFRPVKGAPMASAVPDDPRLKQITPRIVLDHTTGFPNWARGKPLELLANPGEKFGYSGEGYCYLQNVIEHVTGESLDEFARKRVFAPLGMSSTSYIWRDEYEGVASIGYNRDGPQEKWKEKQGLAAATLHTTATDFAKFLGAMLHPPRAGLDEKRISQMLSPQVRLDDSLSWSLGWGLEKRPTGRAFWQWGDNGEFKGFTIGSRDERIALIVLTNSALGLRLCRKIVETVMPGPHPALSFGMLQY